MSTLAAEKRAEALKRKLRPVRAGLRFLEIVAPPLAARAALALFRTPPRHVPWDGELAILASGRELALDVGGDGIPFSRIHAWRWGEGEPVLLVHGWGSSGGRLGSFVAPLVAAGRSVLAFDAPGHGAARVRRSSLPQFIAAVQAAARAAVACGDTARGNGGELAGIIAHSLGGPAVALAMDRGLRARRVVMIAASSDPAGYTRRFADVVGISERTRRRMEERVERVFRVRWSDFDVLAAARRRTTPALLIHDMEDSEVPLSNAEALARAWPGAELVTTRGLGHTRIVHDPAVISRAVGFLSAEQSGVLAS